MGISHYLVSYVFKSKIKNGKTDYKWIKFKICGE